MECHPLHITARQHNPLQMINVFLEAGANIDVKDTDGRTALHIAVGSNNTKAIMALGEAGIDLEVRDKYGETALYRAVAWNRLEMIKMLKNLGSDLEAKSWSV